MRSAAIQKLKGENAARKQDAGWNADVMRLKNSSTCPRTMEALKGGDRYPGRISAYLRAFVRASRERPLVSRSHHWRRRRARIRAGRIPESCELYSAANKEKVLGDAARALEMISRRPSRKGKGDERQG